MTLHRLLIDERGRAIAAKIADCCRATRIPKPRPARHHRQRPLSARAPAPACC